MSEHLLTKAEWDELNKREQIDRMVEGLGAVSMNAYYRGVRVTDMTEDQAKIVLAHMIGNEIKMRQERCGR